VFYLDFLAALHQRLLPRTYLEIGVAEGHSLAVSQCRTVGVDPDFCVTQEVQAPVSLIRATSDEYFDRLQARRATPFGRLPIDLAYIDGLHHFEQALRDFVNVERYSARSSVVAFDDIFPRNVEEAARQRATQAWTGDVFRIPLALSKWRRDVTLVRVSTEPTGTLLVAHLDPANRVLADGLDDIVRDYVEPDPQPVPAAVLRRRQALKPEKALALPIWDELVAARRPGQSLRPAST
jgi:hypothetical protein